MKKILGTIRDFSKVMFIEIRHEVSEDLKFIASHIEPTNEQLEWSKEIRGNWHSVKVVTE